MLEKPHIRSRAALIKEQDIGINASVGAEYALGQPDDRMQIEIFQQLAFEIGFRPRTKIRPSVIENSSRICVKISQPDRSNAGVIYLVQISRSESCFLSIF